MFGSSCRPLNWMVAAAPQIRVRRAADRARDQLADLTVVNERLARCNGADGTDGSVIDAEIAASVRRRVDYLRRRRKIWEMVYQYVVQHDAFCTLAAIEEANEKVEELLKSGDKKGISQLGQELLDLRQDVDEAQTRLSMTQAKVESNLQRLTEINREADRLSSSYYNQGSTIQVLDGPTDYSRTATTTTTTTTRKHASMRRRGLESSLELEDELRNHWFAVQFSSKLKDASTLIPFELFGEQWVLFRDENGQPACVKDECAHRACPLSLGSVVDGQVQCAYHGWRFDGTGACTTMPSTSFCKGISVSALPVVELEGLIWIWPGWKDPGPVPHSAVAPPQGYVVHTEIEMEVPVEHGLLIENLLDLAHAPFTHTGTFAKGWPVPDIVSFFNSGRMLSGYWQPYPIDMAFNPPCMTESLIGLAQPGRIERGARASTCRNHLHQVHICLPARPGHTRLLYRMSMDFLGWARFVPGIQRFWKYIAGQVLGEDLVLVVGQQERMLRGGDTWGHPVSYDKLGVRYRRWRNALVSFDGEQQGPLRMDAGELFALSPEEEEEEKMVGEGIVGQD